MKKTLILYIVSIVITLQSCKKEDVVVSENINDFTWKAMNSWYKWQEDVPSLADYVSKHANYNKYLRYYNNPKSFFESLLYKKGEVDRFSWFIDDYEEQRKLFQGISTSYGIKTSNLIKISESKDDLILYISFVSPNSPADRAGLKRGDIICGFDDIKLTIANHKEVLKSYYSSSAEFMITEKDGTTVKDKKRLVREIVFDNPVHYTKIFDNINNKKVGYLVYNGFRNSYNDELNEAFAKLQGVSELILDFRNNRGGSVGTCAYLASMIHKEAGKSVFAYLEYNKKKSNNNSQYKFEDKLTVYNSHGKKEGEQIINRLSGLKRIFVITSKKTASASEMIINGLRPFIDVILIGEQTAGKNVGSMTLFDSPRTNYTSLRYANPSHKKAMQPITFKIYNKLGESDYTHGFKPEPSLEIEEAKFWNNILPFGDENEVLLKAALDRIRGNSTSRRITSNNDSKSLNEGLIENRFESEMYIEPQYFEK